MIETTGVVHLNLLVLTGATTANLHKLLLKCYQQHFTCVILRCLYNFKVLQLTIKIYVTFPRL